MSSHQHHFLWDSSRKTWDIIGSEAWEPPYFTFFVSEEQLRGAPPWSHTGETGNQRPSTCRTKIGLDWSASSAFFSPVFRWFCYGSIHKSWFFYGFSMVFLGSQRIRHLGPSSGIIPKGTWRCCWSKPWGMSQWSSWGLFEKSLAAWKKGFQVLHSICMYMWVSLFLFMLNISWYVIYIYTYIRGFICMVPTGGILDTTRTYQ